MNPKKNVRKTFDGLSLPVLVIDRDYVIVDANRAAAAHLERTESNVVGQFCFEMTHGSENPCWHTGEVACPVKGAFESKQRVRAIHKHHIGGHLVVEEIVATPLDDGTGRVDFVVEEGRVVLVPATVHVTELKGMMSPPRKAVSLEQMEAAIEAGATARLKTAE